MEAYREKTQAVTAYRPDAWHLQSLDHPRQERLRNATCSRLSDSFSCPRDALEQHCRSHPRAV